MAEQIDYLSKYDRIMYTMIGQLFTRVLGQNTLHAPVEEIYGYFQQLKAERPGSLEAVISEIDNPIFLEFVVKGYVLGENLTMDFRVWGLRKGRNTVFTRFGWWKIRLFELVAALIRRQIAR